jgi:hypothetical protein
MELHRRRQLIALDYEDGVDLHLRAVVVQRHPASPAGDLMELKETLL